MRSAALFSVLVACLLCCTLPSTLSQGTRNTYDFIIVGAGSAGSTVTGELAVKFPGSSFLIIEAGGDATDPMVHNTLVQGDLLNSTFTYLRDDQTTQPAPDYFNYQILVNRGKMTAGSMGVNAMFYVVGDPYEWDTTANDIGDQSWSWASTNKYRNRIPQEYSIYKFDNKQLGGKQYIRAFNNAGWTYDTDATNGINGITNSFQVAYLNPSRPGGVRETSFERKISSQKLANVELLTFHRVSKVLIDSNKKAYGVQVVNLRSNATYQFGANKEVILSGGSFRTPQILQLSGVGPAAVLQAAGIPVVLNAPGVGANLNDHLGLHAYWQSLLPVQAPILYNLPNFQFFGPRATTGGPQYQMEISSGFTSVLPLRMELGGLRTSNGAPVPDNQNSQSIGSFASPILLQDFNLIDKLANFDRERIPERVVHAKGAGAKGYFEVTNDLTKYCKAAFLNQVGKRTPLLARFSTVAGEKGSSDVARDPRGFAVKFYTEEGNWDMVGNNTPVFFVRDPAKFPDFIHTQKRDPQTNIQNANSVWDFIGLSPETIHQIVYLFGDRGIPDGYRHMNGYSSHTLKWVNAEGKATWVKFHFKTESGIKNLTVEEAQRIQQTDLDYATTDLFNHIANGGVAAWKVFVQLMPFEEAFNYRFHPFDVTKIWPHGDYPLIELGRMVLDTNPDNYFAEIEQAAFSPSHMVPGIEPSPDKMLQGRLFSYPDTHRHRLGVNYQSIPVNCPYRVRGGVTNYHRDGFMRMDSNGGNAPNYEPNSFNGPREDSSHKEHGHEITGVIGRYRYLHPQDDYVQARALYERVYDAQQKSRLVSAIAGHMKNICPNREDIKIRALKQFYRVHPELGTRLAQTLEVDVSKIKANL